MTPEEQDIVDALVQAYSQACFPMAEPETSEIGWYRPDPRAILPLDRFRMPENLRRRAASGRFEVTTDTAFERVMRTCAEARPDRRETWIDERIVAWYVLLHRAGRAHSIEAWLPDHSADSAGAGDTGERRLVGGLYGVQVGGLFAGESMFARPELGGTDASKVCLVHLVSHMRRRGLALLDVQFKTPHLERFGVTEVSGRRYRKLLGEAVALDAAWTPFEPERTRSECAG